MAEIFGALVLCGVSVEGSLCPAHREFFETGDTVGGEHGEARADDVGVWRETTLDGARVKPVVGEKNADAVRGGRTNSEIQRGGEAHVRFALDDAQPRPLAMEAIENFAIGGRRLRRCDDNDLARNGLLQCRPHGLLEPPIDLAQQRNYDCSGLGRLDCRRQLSV